MKNRYHETLRSVAALAVAVSMTSACGDSDSAGRKVGGSVVLVDRMAQSLAAEAIDYIVGTYTDCTSHANSDTWSLPASADAGDLPSGLPATLSVNYGDSTCKLAVTQVITVVNDTFERYYARTPIALADTFSGAAAFEAGGDGPLAFYASASLDMAGSPPTPFTGFTANFVIRFIYSDDSNRTQGAIGATVASSATPLDPEGVPSPQYTIGLGSLEQAVVTTSGSTVVGTPTGDVTLTLSDGATEGNAYRVHEGNLSAASYKDIDAAYTDTNNALPAVVNIVEPDGFSVPVQSLIQAGDSLATDRAVSIIIASIVEEVRSYQAVIITFKAPPGGCGGNTPFAIGDACVSMSACEFDGRGTAQDGNCTCKSTATWDPNEQRCDCPADAWWDGEDCRDAAICTADLRGTVNEASDRCDCTSAPGSTWTSSAPCHSCMSNEYFTGNACVDLATCEGSRGTASDVTNTCDCPGNAPWGIEMGCPCAPDMQWNGFSCVGGIPGDCGIDEAACFP